MRNSRLFFVSVLLLTACTDAQNLRSDYPIMPVREYEKLLVGRLDADYIGNDQCLAKCHKHDKIRDDFNLSVHGEQVEASSGLPLVNCESCHGPGSLSVSRAEVDNRCDNRALLQIKELPAQAQSLICLKCHSTASTPNLHYWNAGMHARNDVSCLECHKLHVGPQQKVTRQEMAKLCYGCHPDVRMSFSLSSHHPVPEFKMVCVDCHDPHGSTTEAGLKGMTIRDTCVRCHMEYQGPFVFEHADVSENCIHCHSPHGSPQRKLLVAAQPVLCLRCHPASLHSALKDGNSKQVMYGTCTSCHSSIHGTNVPSANGRGTFLSR